VDDYGLAPKNNTKEECGKHFGDYKIRIEGSFLERILKVLYPNIKVDMLTRNQSYSFPRGALVTYITKCQVNQQVN
jgi:hypothetical protein